MDELELDKSKLNQIFTGINELDGSRGNDLKKVIIDITKRDIEDEHFNIDITIYVRPDVPETMVMPAIQKTCIDVFGDTPQDFIDLFHCPSDHNIGMQAGGQVGVFNSFGVTIKHPHSRYFNIDRLKETFLKRAYKHIQES